MKTWPSSGTPNTLYAGGPVLSLNYWYVVMGVWAAANSRTCYCGQVNSTTVAASASSTTSKSFEGLNRGYVGRAKVGKYTHARIAYAGWIPYAASANDAAALRFRTPDGVFNNIFAGGQGELWPMLASPDDDEGGLFGRYRLDPGTYPGQIAGPPIVRMPHRFQGQALDRRRHAVRGVPIEVF